MNLDNFKKCNNNTIVTVLNLTGKVIDAPSNLTHSKDREKYYSTHSKSK